MRVQLLLHRTVPVVLYGIVHPSRQEFVNSVYLFPYIQYVVKGEKDGCNGELIGSKQVGMMMKVLGV